MSDSGSSTDFDEEIEGRRDASPPLRRKINPDRFSWKEDDEDEDLLDEFLDLDSSQAESQSTASFAKEDKVSWKSKPAEKTTITSSVKRQAPAPDSSIVTASKVGQTPSVAVKREPIWQSSVLNDAKSSTISRAGATSTVVSGSTTLPSSSYASIEDLYNKAMRGTEKKAPAPVPTSSVKKGNATPAPASTGVSGSATAVPPSISYGIEDIYGSAMRERGKKTAVPSSRGRSGYASSAYAGRSGNSPTPGTSSMGSRGRGQRGRGRGNPQSRSRGRRVRDYYSRRREGWEYEFGDSDDEGGSPNYPGSDEGDLMEDVKVEPEDDLPVDDDAMRIAETYADYAPSKLKIGKNHPDPVVETASLASVAPPDIHYHLNLPREVIEQGLLSKLQLEAVVYACQQHGHFLSNGERAGYLIGDGAGVGKGRTIAGIIFENYLLGRKKAIWISVSPDLKYDSERDLDDVGARRIAVHSLSKLDYKKIDLRKGVIFSTYSSLIAKSTNKGSRLNQLLKWCGPDFDGVLVFDESHKAKNLCPSSNSKKPTKTGQAVFRLQTDLPKARVVYASATGASEPSNMAYMTRLGLWGPGTPYRDVKAFSTTVQSRGMSNMELVAMDMKQRGAYIARQLSFKGTTFQIKETPLDPRLERVYDESVELWVEALKKFTKVADQEVRKLRMTKSERLRMIMQFWASHQRFFKYLCIASKVKEACRIAKEAVASGKCAVIGLQSTGEARTMDQLERECELTEFVSTAKGVFEALVQNHFPGGSKVRRVKRKVEELPSFSFETDENENERVEDKKAAKKMKWEVKDEPRSKDPDFDEFFVKLEPWESDDVEEEEEEKDEDDDWERMTELCPTDYRAILVSVTSGVTGMARNTPVEEEEDEEYEHLDPEEEQMKLLEKIDDLGKKLPTNTLDELIKELGGPKVVAEMTGRSGRIVQKSSGRIKYENRATEDINLENLNMEEKRMFMEGEKLIAIISEAASTGISLQSDKRVRNQRRRVHITLELPWSADRAIQQFGRTHRSNQVNAPEYVFLISNLAGEYRFASIVAKRLESLGALTHGDRRATETRDLSQFNVDTKYGVQAMRRVINVALESKSYKWMEKRLQIPEGFSHPEMKEALAGAGLANENANGSYIPEKNINIKKFLNRMLGMRVKEQNMMFKFFADTMDRIIAEEKKLNRYDLGILDLRITKDCLFELVNEYTRRHATGPGLIRLHKIEVERGMTWDESFAKFRESSVDRREGYYLSDNIRCEKRRAILAMADTAGGVHTWKCSVFRPNIGLSELYGEKWDDILDKFTRVSPEEAKPFWEMEYEASKTLCMHAFWSGNCKNNYGKFRCDYGLLRKTYHILSGNVLIVWEEVCSAIKMYDDRKFKMQIVRAVNNDTRVVGLIIPNNSVESVKEVLKEGEMKEKNKAVTK